MAREPTSSYISVNNLKLHYLDWGETDGIPLVMLHGLRAYGHWFDEFATEVGPRFRPIALDQRGRGFSDWASDKNYSRSAYVSDLSHFIEALNLDKVVLIGHSMGGLNCFHYAANEIERVLAFVAIDIGPEIAPDGLARIKTELGATPEFFESWAEAVAFIDTNHSRASVANRKTRLQCMLRETENGVIEWRLDPDIFDPNIKPDSIEETWAAVRKIQCPTLLVRGEFSDILAIDTCREMVDFMGDCRFVEISGAGHLVIEDHPKAFNEAVLNFLTTLL